MYIANSFNLYNGLSTRRKAYVLTLWILCQDRKQKIPIKRIIAM